MSGKSGLREVKVWTPDLAMEQRPDGTYIVSRRDALGAYPDRLTDKVRHWATVAPERTWMAARDGGGDWTRIRYGELEEILVRLGTFLLGFDLGPERPLLILSENALEHAMIALAAQHVGIPSAAISPAYSLMSGDFAKLSQIVAQITPGMIFVQTAAPFQAAIDAALAPDIPAIAVSGSVSGRTCHAWNTVFATAPDHPAVDAAHQATGPDTVAKFLFTSGTTGSPKAVIQTQRMLCANQEMIADCFQFMRDDPPVFVDWAPWNHTASGNKVFNMTLYHGGSYYLDAGRPTKDGIAETIRNLTEISPTWYFNVPVGYDFLVAEMEQNADLRRNFFRNLRMLMYAGAGLAAHTWTRLGALAQDTTGEQVLMTTGLGSTETGPFSLYCTTQQDGPGNVGIPAQGLTLKLVPSEDKLEARVKGPNITPGYWRDAKQTADAFDDEGFYRLGDALRFAVPGQPEQGFFFDGRIAENFKLQTGTWVSVGPLRAQLIDQMQGLVRDVVVIGENEPALAAILVPAPGAMRDLIGDPTLTDAQTLHHPDVRAALQARLADHCAAATGSATRITRAIVLEDPLSLDKGEVTDKGSVNQRAVIRNHPELVAKVYGDGATVLYPSA